MIENESTKPLILLTGATGYIGGRLLDLLERQGLRLRCMARRPEYLKPKVAESTEVVFADVLDKNSLPAVLEGVTTVYYLIHSMGSSDSFEDEDRLAALNFGQAAKKAGVKRIIYLGGLGDDDEMLSPHLRSRQEVGEILRESGIEVFEFRASIVIGSGSLSFEMIRSLVERLPVMITPKWVSMSAQPIAIEDLLAYLLQALELPESESRIFEIGGKDIVSYADIMKVYARCRNINITMIPVPVLTPYLSSLWLGLITPLYTRIGKKLIESIVHATVVKDQSALDLFTVKPIGIEEAIKQALSNEDKRFANTRWSDALSSSGKLATWTGVEFGTRLIDTRTKTVALPAKDAFRPIQKIGGKTGWYAWNILWRIRGFLDLLVGGIGLRRGRAADDTIQVGDTIDFWRVEKYEPNHLLRLQAEMKLPGRAWLEFEVNESDGKSEIRQTAIFDPVGLFGRIYWYMLIPMHQLVFKGMLENIKKTAAKEHSD